MPDQNSSSFIPQSAKKSRRPRKSKRVYIFSYISYVFFFGTLLSVVGVYVYLGYVEGQREAQQASLAKEREALSADNAIEEIRVMDAKLQLVEDLLNSTLAPSKIFTVLEDAVVDPVVLTGFEYERSETETVTLTISGTAENFSAAIVQRDIFDEEMLFGNAVDTSFTYGNESGDSGMNSGGESSEMISITLTAKPDTNAFRYTPQQLESDTELLDDSSSDAGDVNQIGVGFSDTTTGANDDTSVGSGTDSELDVSFSTF